MSQSNPPSHSAKPEKPAKPYPEFPLFAHATRRWAKKIRGKLHYFGPWADPQGSLDKYLGEKDDLHAGRKPRGAKGGFTVADLGNEYLKHKWSLMQSGELSPRTYRDYEEVCDLVVDYFGKTRLVADLRQDDFAALRVKLAKRYGLVRLGNVIQRIRSQFKYAFDEDHIEKPVKFGQGFVRPKKKTQRIARAKQGQKLFTREEIHQLLDAATVQLRAMTLLAVNCGFGNADVGRLPLSALDLDGAMVEYPREKTGARRRCPLWPETVRAIRVALAERLDPKDAAHSGLVFITGQRGSWFKDTPDSPVAKAFAPLMKRAKVGVGRKGLGFYTLRHVHRTVADEAKDQPAANFIMGHEMPDMSEHYREEISDERLKAVTDCIHDWLFAPPARKDDKAEAEHRAGELPDEADVDRGDDGDSPAVLKFPQRCPA